jgi:hypothetical protein
MCSSPQGEHCRPYGRSITEHPHRHISIYSLVVTKRWDVGLVSHGHTSLHSRSSGFMVDLVSFTAQEEFMSRTAAKRIGGVSFFATPMH